MKKKFVKARGWKKLLCASLAVALFTGGTFSNYATALYESWKGGTRLKGTYDFMLTPHKDFGATTIAHMNNALYEWNKYLPSGVKGIKREPTLRHSSTAYTDTPDGKNYIYRKNMGKFDDKIAEASWYHYKGDIIVIEADVVLNTYYPFANSGIADHYDVWSVFLHEAGHILGFNDMDPNAYSWAVMCGEGSPGVEKRTISVTEQYVLKDIYK
ncbi:MAG: hypothetical protein HFE94_07470 [Acutalibacter sp.]|nr:hypothetical protein [Acutalibacter sp.]